ncbi:hypothetical protein RIF29_38070 [Crotalaria pallida]|uniref:Uncharacterized protein n=1 Tax=Crotalaria pallida TaxID=3830 RepID=A0AAN9E4X6_CROPI
MLSRVWVRDDIYFPSKRNSLGKRFAFVRFNKVMDAMALEKCLDNLWFGNKKVWANISKYEKYLPMTLMMNVEGGRIEGKGPDISKDCENLDYLHNDYGDLFDWWCSEICSWTSAVKSSSWKVWMACHGVPVHAWPVQFFSIISIKVGKFVSMHPMTLSKQSLDVVLVQICTNDFRVIRKVLKAKMNSTIFDILIVEQPLWLDCVGGSTDSCDHQALNWVIGSQVSKGG